MTISASRYTHCNYYPGPDRNPISDSSGAFRVEHGLTMCHHSSQAKLPEDALDFTQTTTISMRRKHRPGRGLPSHYQIKQFQQSLESRWYPSIAPLCGFRTTLNRSQTNTCTSKPWKKKNLPRSTSAPSSPPPRHHPRHCLFLNLQLLQQRRTRSLWDVFVHRTCLKEINDYNLGLQFPRASLCRRRSGSWGNTEVGAACSPEVAFPKKMPHPAPLCRLALRSCN